MYVYEDHSGEILAEEAVGRIKGGVHGLHVDNAHQVDDGNLKPAQVEDAQPAPRRGGGEVSRAQKRFAGVEKLVAFLSAKGVVPRGDDVHAALKKIIGGGGRDAVAIR